MVGDREQDISGARQKRPASLGSCGATGQRTELEESRPDASRRVPGELAAVVSGFAAQDGVDAGKQLATLEHAAALAGC